MTPDARRACPRPEAGPCCRPSPVRGLPCLPFRGPSALSPCAEGYTRNWRVVKAECACSLWPIKHIKLTTILHISQLSELKEGITDCERRLAKLKHQLDIDGTVLHYLQVSRTKALAELLAAIPTGVGNLLNRITAGRYHRVDGEGFDLRVWSDQKGEPLELQEMSGGTIDQFYPALSA